MGSCIAATILLIYHLLFCVPVILPGPLHVITSGYLLYLTVVSVLDVTIYDVSIGYVRYLGYWCIIYGEGG